MNHISAFGKRSTHSVRPQGLRVLAAALAVTGHCQEAFAARGARVAAVDLGTPVHAGSRHSGSNVAGTARIARWFSQLPS